MDDKYKTNSTTIGSIITENEVIQTDFDETTSLSSLNDSQNVKSSTTSASIESASDKTDDDSTTSTSPKELLNIPRRYKKRIILTNG
jgi:hypothetical protein